MYSVIYIYLLELGGGENILLKQQNTKLNCGIGWIFVFPALWSVYIAVRLPEFQRLKHTAVTTTPEVAAPCLGSWYLSMSKALHVLTLWEEFAQRLLYRNMLVTLRKMVTSRNIALQCKPISILFYKAILLDLKLLLNATENSIPAEQGKDYRTKQFENVTDLSPWSLVIYYCENEFHITYVCKLWTSALSWKHLWSFLLWIFCFRTSHLFDCNHLHYNSVLQLYDCDITTHW